MVKELKNTKTRGKINKLVTLELTFNFSNIFEWLENADGKLARIDRQPASRAAGGHRRDGLTGLLSLSSLVTDTIVSNSCHMKRLTKTLISTKK